MSERKRSVSGPDTFSLPQSVSGPDAVSPPQSVSDPDAVSPPQPQPPSSKTLPVASTSSRKQDDSASRSGWYGFSLLVLAVLFAWLCLKGYDKLTHSYPPTTLKASTKNLGDLQSVTLTAGSEARVWWMQRGSIRRLVVSGPIQGSAEVILPLPESQCHKMAAQLGISCLHGKPLQIGNPVTFAWSKPEPISSTGGRAIASTVLNIITSLRRRDSLGVTMAAQARASPSVCFEAPYSKATLTVTSGRRHFRYSGPWQAASCAAGTSNVGVVVHITLSGHGHPPWLEFDHISTLAVCASAPAATVQGFAGEIHLTPGATTVLGTPTMVSLGSQRAAMVILDIGPNSQVGAPTSCLPGNAAVPAACSATPSPGSLLAVCSVAATSVSTDSGQLVPSEWARRNEFLTPLLGGVITALVITPLGVSLQILMDALKRFRLRMLWDFLKRLLKVFRWRARKTASKNKEVSHAP